MNCRCAGLRAAVVVGAFWLPGGLSGGASAGVVPSVTLTHGTSSIQYISADGFGANETKFLYSVPDTFSHTYSGDPNAGSGAIGQGSGAYTISRAAGMLTLDIDVSILDDAAANTWYGVSGIDLNLNLSRPMWYHFETAGKTQDDTFYASFGGITVEADHNPGTPLTESVTGAHPTIGTSGNTVFARDGYIGAGSYDVGLMVNAHQISSDASFTGEGAAFLHLVFSDAPPTSSVPLPSAAWTGLGGLIAVSIVGVGCRRARA